MPPSTEWREKIEPDEAARFEKYASDLHVLQRRRARGGPAARALHAKTHVGIEARFTVLPELPEHARVGFFNEPATYPAYVRFSNGSGASQSDRKPDARGMAVKVVGVHGEKTIPGMENAYTQDFSLIRTPATPFHNADEFIALIFAVLSPAGGLPRLAFKYGLGRTATMLRRIAQDIRTPMTSLATTQFYSAVPIQFGPYAIKYTLAPHAKPDTTPLVRTPDYLGEDIARRLGKGPILYDFRVQFFVDEQKTPIEDAAVEWKEADAPFVTLARLTLIQQDLQSPRAVKISDFVESLSFDPWHALKELKPLGNMMRARSVAYRASTQERQARAEPDGTEAFVP